MKAFKPILVFVVGFMLSVCQLFAQQKVITGKIIDVSDKSPVAFANVVLRAEDSTFISGSISNFDGDFEIKHNFEGSYRLYVSCVGYTTACVSDENTAEILLSPASVALDEVTIQAHSVIVKGDRKLILPSEEQVRTSTDGVDMLRKMQLPRMMVDPVSGEITMSGNKTVQLRVNGVQVTNAEIASIPPADIVRIEYHDDPGARYGNVDAVVDYITRRKDAGMNINGVLYNGAGEKRMSADDRLSLKYSNGKSEWSANAVYVQRRGYWTREYDEWLVFPDAEIHRLETGEPTLFNKKTFTGNLNYSLMDSKYFFNAQVGCRRNDFPNAFEDRKGTLYETDNSDAPLSVYNHTVEKSNSPVIDLYYQRNLENNQQLVVNVVGTYIGTDSKHIYREQNGNSIETEIWSNITGNKYSLIAEGIYEKRFGTNKITGGIRHLQSYTGNKYEGTAHADVSMRQTESSAYAEYQGKTGKWGYMANVAAVRLHYSQDDQQTVIYALQPSARITFEPNRDSYLRYRVTLRNNAPSLASMNDVEQVIDSWQVRRGNPDLKAFHTFSQSFSAGYNKGIWGADLTTGYDREYNPVMESVFYGNGVFVHSEENQKSFQNLSAELTFKISPWKKHLSVSVTPKIDRFTSEGNNYRHTYTMTELRANLDFSYNNWIANFTTITPPRFMYGEHVTKSDQMYTIMAGYKMPTWSLMVGVLNPFTKEYKTDNKNWAALNPVNSVIHTTNTKAFLVKLSVNLNYGKQTKGVVKRVQNSDTDAGIMQGSKE